VGGFFGVVSSEDCVADLFYGTDYHSHLGTQRGGMVVSNGNGFTRSIHNITKAQTEKLREAYRSAITQVGPGYTAVSIFENFMPGTAEIQEVISSMIKMAPGVSASSATSR